MSAMDEAATGKTPLGAALEAGVENISYFQNVAFTLYARVVLPLDGFVFWVRAASLSPSALFNAAVLNGFAYNQASTIASLAPAFTQKGSLHFATNVEQTESETFSTNRVIFTSEGPVENLNAMRPGLMYVAKTSDGTRFSFSSRDNFYQQAGLWHYGGAAVYSDLASQIVDDPGLLNTTELIVSNSLPIWLAMNRYVPFVWEAVPAPSFPLYPSMTVPLNLTPKFASVHVEPTETRALASAPRLSSDLSHDQLVRDLVRITTYGVGNDEAMDLIDFVNQYSQTYQSVFGLMNVPVIRDEKRGQVELNALSQKKTVGSCHTAARFSASWNAPCAAAPSPKNAIEASSAPSR